MSAAIKGYVVRGKNRQGQAVVCCTEDGAALRQAPPSIDPVFSSLDVANKARGAMLRRGWCTDDVAIFRVLDDGREERLPSYEEALALLDGATSSDAYLANVSTQLLATMRENDRLRAIEVGDPLAALEAAERRLLEAGGWRIEPSAWTHGAERWERGGENESRQVALTIERRRIAAKGGV